MFLISFYIKTSKEAVFCHIRPNSGLLSQKQKNSLIKLKSRQFSRYFQIFSDIKSRILVSLKKAKGRVFNRGQPGGLWMWYQIVTWNLLWWGCRWFGVLLCGFSTNRQRLWFKNFCTLKKVAWKKLFKINLKTKVIWYYATFAHTHKHLISIPKKHW